MIGAQQVFAHRSEAPATTGPQSLVFLGTALWLVCLRLWLLTLFPWGLKSALPSIVSKQALVLAYMLNTRHRVARLIGINHIHNAVAILSQLNLVVSWGQ